MRLRWGTGARTDLFSIAGYYDELEPGLGDRLLQRIEKAPLILCERPRMGAPVGVADLRKWSVRGLPFILLYRILADEVEVARVLHAASDWRRE